MTTEFDNLMDELFLWLSEYGGMTVADVMEDTMGFYIIVDFEGESGSSNPKKVRVPEKFNICL